MSLLALFSRSFYVTFFKITIAIATCFIAMSVYGQTQVYNVTGVVNMPSNCGTAGPYNCTAGAQIGFDWTDVIPASNNITSVSIEFREGVECSPGAHAWYLNGVNQGNVTTLGNACACTVGSAPSIVLSGNPANYVKSGANSFRVTVGSSCLGFYPNWSGGTVYGIVTVQYSSACPSAISGTSTIAIGGTTTLSTSFTNGGGITYSGTSPIIATRVFTASSTFTTVQALTAEVLVVGGGGGGGSRHGGGGGGGGVQYNASLAIPANTYTVTVGAGGAAGWYGGGLVYNGAQGAGDKGGNTTFGGLITAFGGGGGRTYDGGDGTGASGGGGTGTGAAAANRNGGAATQGFAGGTGSTNVASGGGGGGAGGAGSAVSPATGNANGGNGGVGVSNSITGSAVFYGGGGGGGAAVGAGLTGGLGGNGGGGHGGDNGGTGSQTAGAANTGGGGGGCRSNSNEAGSAGGSGIVVIKYTAGVWSSSNPSVATVNATTGLVTGVSGGTTVIRYTSTGGCVVSQVVTVTPATVCPGTNITLTAPLPTGGTITNSGTDRIHTFNSSGTFTAPQAITTGRVMVVAGGGGGGSNGGGGGGAGGLSHNTSYPISAGNTSVTVGGGGAAAVSSSVTGSSGGSSSFGSYTATGGGGGASRDGGGAGLAGGSGGGGGGGSNPQFVAGVGSQGFNGGTGSGDLGCNSTGAGGGGAGGAGTSGGSNLAGNGGVGVSNNISGAAIFYAGGGGGGTTNFIGCGGSSVTNGTNGTGGSGGGGNGESTAGTANTGGGGGAERAGGSGIVIVRYAGGSWGTSNPAVATIGSVDIVSGTATINTVGGGTATITYTNPNGVAYPITVTVNSTSVAPTGATGVTTICTGSNTTLTVSGGSAGTGATAQWFTGSCGGTSAGTGNAINVAPTSTTTYYVRYSGTCGSPTACGTATVTVNQPSAAPTSITGTSTICTGGSTTLTSSGGSLGTNAVDVWYTGSCTEAFDQAWNSQPYGSGSTTLNSATNGVINVTSTTNDPMIFMDALGSFDPATNRYINIRYRVTAGTASGVEIFFYNVAHNFAVGGETGFGSLISDGNWHVVSVDMHADPDYLTGGNILGWRFDWATNSGVTMDIDFTSLSTGPMIESGPSINVSPTSTTTYFTSKKGTCNNTSCTSQAVTVRPTPTASISGTTTVCENGTSPNITFTNPMALPVTVTYNINGGSNTTVNVGASTTANVAAPTGTAGSFAYNLVSVVYQTAPTCSNPISGTATVTVRPTPTASISGTTSICQNAASPNVTFTNPMVLPVTVTYNINGGSNTTVNIGASTIATVAVPTGTAGPFAYNLVSVVYQSAPTCSNGLSGSATVTVNAIPASFTPSIVTTTPICFRGTAQIQVPSSVAGVTYQLRENATNVGSSHAGNGGTLSFGSNSLIVTNNNYNVLATNGFSCTTSVAVASITVDATPVTYASNGDARTCYVNTNNYVEFRSANGIIMAINSNGQNLGNVTVTEYNAGSPINVQACDTYQPWYVTAALGRHWVVTPQFQPASAVSVRLYFDNNDYTALQIAANANANPNDNIAALGSLDLSKYSNTGNPAVVNGVFADNCSGGSSTVHPVVVSGNISALSDLGSFTGTGRYTQYSFTGFSELWLSGTNNVSPLPIELTSFTATCNNGDVKLDWTTATEINNEKFIIERSANLQTWEEVSIVPGAGNSNESLNYSSLDERPIDGLSYYRLTQRDYDGASETFDPISVTCYNDGKGNTMMVYPNPVDNYFTVSLNMAQAIHDGTIEITDITGKTVIIKNVHLNKGLNEFMFDRTQIQPGQYIIRLKSEQLTIAPLKLIAR